MTSLKVNSRITGYVILIFAASPLAMSSGQEIGGQTSDVSNGETVMPKGRFSDLSKEAVVRIAATEIGFKHFDLDQTDVLVTHFGSRTLPFLRQDLSGKAAYRVTFRDVDLRAATGLRELHNPNITSLNVLVSAETGHVIKLASFWPDDVPRIADYPSSIDEEHQMGATEVYSGIPAQEPISLAKVLSQTQPWSSNVKQIYACYVKHTCLQHKDRAVWIIQLRGTGLIPFSGAAGRQIPDDARNHFRNVVDATTGEWLWGDTIPQPAGPLENRF